MLTLLIAGNIGRNYGLYDKTPTSNQEGHFDALEQWGFNLESAYHFSEKDLVIPKGSNPCFFIRRPCLYSNKEQKNELGEIVWNVVRYYDSMNIPLKVSMLEEILNDDSNTVIRL